MVTSRRQFATRVDNTAKERRDQQEDTPRRKRPRVESDDEDSPRSRSTPSPPKPRVAAESEVIAKPDPDYFKADVDAKVIVRVADVLFKIHRQILDCSDLMATCLQDHENQYGPTTVAKPLAFKAPSLNEYRAFLWATYATSEELKLPPTTDEDLNRLFDVTALGTKYCITKLETWVTYSLGQAADNSALMESCSSATLTRFVNVAISQKSYSVLKRVTDKWCERILAKGTPSVPAIHVVDAHEGSGREEITKLRGIAYYVHIQDMLDRQGSPTESGATILRTDPKLANAQVMRLMAGYFSLISLWERLRLNPVELEVGENCSEEVHTKCRSAWKRRWTSAAGWKRIMGCNSADILGLLGTLQDQLSNDDDLRAGLTADCRRKGLAEIKLLKGNIQESLADHFTGMT